MKFLEDAKRVADKLKRIPKIWDGRGSVLEMRDAGFPHWRQMEWIGFYFQFLCENNLKDIMQIPGPRYGNVSFDGFLGRPWDFKAHAMNTSTHQIIVNDSEAVARAIEEHNEVGVVLALGKVKYNDEARKFQKWHEKIKGEESKYVKDRKQRGAWSRLRKVSLELQQISFICITDATLIKTGSFQEDFRNSNGLPRRPKMLIDLEKIDKELIHYIEF